MKILALVTLVWNFVSRIARVLVKIDDVFIEAKEFWDWLFGDEPEEPEDV